MNVILETEALYRNVTGLRFVSPYNVQFKGFPTKSIAVTFSKAKGELILLSLIGAFKEITIELLRSKVTRMLLFTKTVFPSGIYPVLLAVILNSE